MNAMKPMEAVAALYADGREEAARGLIDGLGRAVFGTPDVAPASRMRQVLARLSYRIVRRTTRCHEQDGATVYRNRVLERSGHPYAQALMGSSHQGVARLVEGGDPMNGPYLMLVPEVRAAGGRWDRLFFDSVMGRDVQLRFIWETLATHQEATRRLRAGRPVHLMAVAAGTGLSMILAYIRLLADGHDPDLMAVTITDREAPNTDKTRRLLSKLPAARDRVSNESAPGQLAVFSADIFAEAPMAGPPADVITAVGIFEYLAGHTCDTTERRLGEPQLPEAMDGAHLARRLAALTSEEASLVVNSYRPHHSIRLLENFGKKFDFRTRENLAALLAPAGFHPDRLLGSAVVYDVEIYKKSRVFPAG